MLLIGLAASPKLKNLIFKFRLANAPNRICTPLINCPSCSHLLNALGCQWVFEKPCFTDPTQQPTTRSNPNIFLELACPSCSTLRVCPIVDRSLGPEVTLLRHVWVNLLRDKAAFNLHCGANYVGWDQQPVWTTISCEATHWHISLMSQLAS